MEVWQISGESKFFIRFVLAFTAVLLSATLYVGMNTAGARSKVGGTVPEDVEYADSNSSDTDSESAEPDEEIEESEENSVETQAVAANSNEAVSLQKKKSHLIVVDAGHGGYDVGSIGPSGTREKNNTLPVALKLGALLEKKGIKVVYTRKSDKVSWPGNVKTDLLSRAEIANNAKADLFISIHNNSSTYKSIRGTETYYSYGSTKGKAIAAAVQKQIVKKAATKDRGIRSEDFSVLRNVKAPAILVELGYLSNATEEKNLGSPTYQQKFAEAIAEAVFTYYGYK